MRVGVLYDSFGATEIIETNQEKNYVYYSVLKRIRYLLKNSRVMTLFLMTC